MMEDEAQGEHGDEVDVDEDNEDEEGARKENNRPMGGEREVGGGGGGGGEGHVIPLTHNQEDHVSCTYTPDAYARSY